MEDVLGTYVTLTLIGLAPGRSDVFSRLNTTPRLDTGHVNGLQMSPAQVQVHGFLFSQVQVYAYHVLASPTGAPKRSSDNP